MRADRICYAQLLRAAATRYGFLSCAARIKQLFLLNFGLLVEPPPPLGSKYGARIPSS